MLIFSVFPSEVFANLQSADVRAHHSRDQPDGEGEGVPDGPVDEHRAAVRVPVSGSVYDGGDHDHEDGYDDGPNEGDQEVQPGHRGGQADCQDVYHGPADIIILKYFWCCKLSKYFQSPFLKNGQ